MYPYAGKQLSLTSQRVRKLHGMYCIWQHVTWYVCWKEIVLVFIQLWKWTELWWNGQCCRQQDSSFNNFKSSVWSDDRKKWFPFSSMNFLYLMVIIIYFRITYMKYFKDMALFKESSYSTNMDNCKQWLNILFWWYFLVCFANPSTVHEWQCCICNP